MKNLIKLSDNQYVWFATLTLLSILPVFVKSPVLLEIIQLLIVIIASAYVARFFFPPPKTHAQKNPS